MTFYLAKCFHVEGTAVYRPAAPKPCEYTNPAESNSRRKRKRKRRGGRSYLRLHGPVHGGGLGGRATIGEWFRGAGRQWGLLGRSGSLRGALNVLTVALVGLV